MRKEIQELEDLMKGILEKKYTVFYTLSACALSAHPLFETGKQDIGCWSVRLIERFFVISNTVAKIICYSTLKG